jgi:hypothetical protein
MSGANPMNGLVHFRQRALWAGFGTAPKLLGINEYRTLSRLLQFVTQLIGHHGEISDNWRPGMEPDFAGPHSAWEVDKLVSSTVGGIAPFVDD